MSGFSIPPSHPRYQSLLKRERIIEGFKKGIVAHAGLIAHGRGEAFDYLIGEKTREFGLKAEKAAVAAIMLAENPVFSVNGNVAALAVDDVIFLAEALGMKIEVNLFYRTEDRVRRIADLFRSRGVEVLGENPDARIPGLDHARALCTSEGIFSADVVLVPLEDGDRTKALRDMGKFVVTVDLNPLSRTARTADVTVVDEITRALRNMREIASEMSREEARKILDGYDNGAVLSEAILFIRDYLGRIASQTREW